MSFWKSLLFAPFSSPPTAPSMIEKVCVPEKVYELHGTAFLECLKTHNLYDPVVLVTMEENKIYSVRKKRDKDRYALKVTSSTMDYNNEIYVLEKLKHPNIVALYDYFHFAINRNYYCLLLEYIDGYDLFEFRNQCGKIYVQTLFSIMQQTSKALAYIHNAEIVHMDIKPENIMYVPSTNMVKIIDFGAARDVGTKFALFAGTCGFVAPESIFGLLKAPVDILERYDYLNHAELPLSVLKKSDVWSFGITLYDLLYEKLPFGETLEEEYNTLINYLRNKDITDIIEKTYFSLTICNEDSCGSNVRQSNEHPFPNIATENKMVRVLITICQKCLDVNHNTRSSAHELCKLFEMELS